MFRRAEEVLDDLSEALAPQAIKALAGSLFWLTVGRTRQRSFALGCLGGAVLSLVAVRVALWFGMAISTPMMWVLMILGGYLAGHGYAAYAEMTGRHSTPELQAIAAARAASEAEYQALEVHEDHLKRSGATPDEIQAQTGAKRRAVLVRLLRSITEVTGDTSNLEEGLRAARVRRDEGYEAITVHGEEMRSRGVSAAEIEAELRTGLAEVHAAYAREIAIAPFAVLFRPVWAARLRRDEAFDALDMHAAHMKKHGATEEEIERELGPRRLAATDTLLREINTAREPRPLGPGAGEPE